MAGRVHPRGVGFPNLSDEDVEEDFVASISEKNKQAFKQTGDAPAEAVQDAGR